VEIIFITIPITLLFITGGAILFFWASKKGQFDDLDSPAHRILFDDDDIIPEAKEKDKSSLSEDTTKTADTDSK
jgi:cbb3-type cytochrome oxidase maturation protein